jgi:uncharacterized protein (DUF1330 family)
VANVRDDKFGSTGTGGEKMAAYVIGHVTVKDPEKWAEYRMSVPATLAPWGGEVILRGRRIAVLSGTHLYTDTVVIRFPDAEAISRWYNSPRYQALIPTHEQAAEMVLISYEA